MAGASVGVIVPHVHRHPQEVGKCAPARTRSQLTNPVRRVPATSVIHGLSVPGDRTNARYVAVAATADSPAACPDQNDNSRSVDVQPPGEVPEEQLM
jgi:hypothetical protein